MARKPSSGMLTKMGSTQESTFGDVCNILRVSKSTGTYSDDETTTITGTFSVPCGFYFTNGVIEDRGQILVVDYDIVLRLPVGTSLDNDDQIQLVSKGNTSVSGTFVPAHAMEIGPTANTLRLKRRV